MSKNARWALAIVGVVILIVAAVLIGTNKDNTDATQPPPGGAAGQTSATGGTGRQQRGSTGSTSTGGPTSGAGSGGASPGGSGNGNGGAGMQNDSGGAPAANSANTVLLRSGRVKTLTVNKGETVTILARSSKPAEVHVHGYDKSVDVEPGKTAKLTFTANIDGEFEIEFEQTGERIGTLDVQP